VDGVAQILAYRREKCAQPPPIAVHVPNKVKGYHVKPANLSDYDALSEIGNSETNINKDNSDD
jgi:hypothetical protein